MGCIEASVYLWKNRFGALGISKVREMSKLVAGDRSRNIRLSLALDYSGA
jgi:hypothetical protein